MHERCSTFVAKGKKKNGYHQIEAVPRTDVFWSYISSLQGKTYDIIFLTRPHAGKYNKEGKRKCHHSTKIRIIKSLEYQTSIKSSSGFYILNFYAFPCKTN